MSSGYVWKGRERSALVAVTSGQRLVEEVENLRNENRYRKAQAVAMMREYERLYEANRKLYGEVVALRAHLHGQPGR